MRNFENGQRIQITAVSNCAVPPLPTVAQQLMAGQTGTVVRLLRRDNSAWVKMDDGICEKLREFPADDEHGRGNTILLYPEECKKFKG